MNSLLPLPVVPAGYVLVPTDPSPAMLRPFHSCPPDELILAWQAALLIARRAAPDAKSPGEEWVRDWADYWRQRALRAEDAYRNMREWAEQNGMNTTAADSQTKDSS